VLRDRIMIIIFLITYIILSYFVTKRLSELYSSKLNSRLNSQILTITTFLILVLVIPYFIKSIIQQTFFSTTITKSIDSNYYYTQQDYFYPLDGGGKRILLYKTNDYWFDKNILEIEIESVYDTFDLKIENQNEYNLKRIILISNRQTQLDTTLNINKFTKFRHTTN